MSHEIRTPLNGVMGIAGALSRTELSAPQPEMVRLIETSAQTLERPAHRHPGPGPHRGRAGMEIRPEPFDMATSVNACAALFEASAQAKGLELTVGLDPYAQRRLRGRRGPRIRQILTNLLGNAVKFTSQGEVRLQVSAPARRDHHPPHLHGGPTPASASDEADLRAAVRPLPAGRRVDHAPVSAARAWAWPSQAPWPRPWAAS